MKGILTFSLLVMIGFTGCQKEIDSTFLITETSIGQLDKKSLVRDLEVIFTNDSIVADTVVQKFGNSAKKIKIFQKGGTHLLTLTPSADSIPTIENIHVHDIRYRTDKGIGPASTFKEIREKYTINKIQTSMNNIIVFLKNSDIYFTIDKKELPPSLRYASSTNIEAVQIPDEAKVKYMMLGWDNL